MTMYLSIGSVSEHFLLRNQSKIELIFVRHQLMLFSSLCIHFALLTNMLSFCPKTQRQNNRWIS